MKSSLTLVGGDFIFFKIVLSSKSNGANAEGDSHLIDWHELQWYIDSLNNPLTKKTT